jgi:hypothetical protein
MMKPNRRDRDEFMKALDEARRAAMAADEEASAAQEQPPSSSEFLRALDRMAGALRTYISTGLLARLYADGETRSAPDPEPELEAVPEPPPPPAPAKSEHEAVVDELHLTPGLSAQDLARIRREFAKANHPDRVVAPQREEATRRMTIANSVIDEALRGKTGRPH